MKFKKKILITFLFLLAFHSPSEAQEKEFYVNHIIIQGNHAYTRSEIYQVLQLQEKQTYTLGSIQPEIRKVENFYREQGYSLCEVSGYFDLNNNLIINIREGSVEEIIFLGLGYFEVFLVREEFGNYREKVFYKPVIEEKLERIAKLTNVRGFSYEFVPVTERKGVYRLYVAKKRGAGSKDGKKEPYTDVYFNFRGWALSLVPYLHLNFYNWGGIDHRLRLGVDLRFATLKWTELKFQESIVNEYYAMNYYSPPIYGDLRTNFYTGVFIRRLGRSDLGVNFKTIQYPFQFGFGFDFRYFWSSLRFGVLYEKLRNISFQEETLVSFNEPYNYPEFLQESDEMYNLLSVGLHWRSRKKYMKEKDDNISLELDYYFNESYSWYKAQLVSEFYFILDYDIFVFRYKAALMNGTYPTYHLFEPLDGEHMRGYGQIATDRYIATGAETWNSIYDEYIHQIFLLDAGWYNNITYDENIAMGDFALTYGFGISFSYQEMNLRFYYSIPILQRADRGTFDFFFRKRF